MRKRWLALLVAAMMLLVGCGKQADTDTKPTTLPDRTADTLKPMAVELAQAVCDLDFAALSDAAAIDPEAQGEIVDWFGMKNKKGKILFQGQLFDSFGDYIAHYDEQASGYLTATAVSVNRVTIYEAGDTAAFDQAKTIEYIGYELIPEVTDRYDAALDALTATRSAVVEVVVQETDAKYLMFVCLAEIDGEWKCLSPSVVIGMQGSGMQSPTYRYLRKIKE